MDVDPLRSSSTRRRAERQARKPLGRHLRNVDARRLQAEIELAPPPNREAVQPQHCSKCYPVEERLHIPLVAQRAAQARLPQPRPVPQLDVLRCPAITRPHVRRVLAREPANTGPRAGDEPPGRASRTTTRCRGAPATEFVPSATPSHHGRPMVVHTSPEHPRPLTHHTRTTRWRARNTPFRPGTPVKRAPRCPERSVSAKGVTNGRLTTHPGGHRPSRRCRGTNRANGTSPLPEEQPIPKPRKP